MRPLLVVGLALTSVASVGVAAESVGANAARGGNADPFPPFLSDVPPEAQRAAPVLRQVLQVVTSTQDAERAISQFQNEQDSVKTKLTAVNGELEMLGQRRDSLTAQFTARDHQQQERLDALRKELEGKLEQELAATRAQISQAQEQDLLRQLQGFDARHAQLADQTLDQEVQLKERELTQLQEELQVQTQELVNRLSRLEVKPDVAKSVEHSATQAIQERRAQLAAARAQVKTRGEARLAQLRQEFADHLRQQQAAELQRRLTVKEASLRSAMAQLLHQTREESERAIASVRADLEQVRQRYADASQQQAILVAKLDALGPQIAAETRRREELAAKRQATLARLEQTFQTPSSAEQTRALTWLGETIQYLPPEIASELGLLQQRLMALAQQARQLEEQRRILRERQLALQLSRQMEAQYQQQQVKQRQEEEAKAKRAEELIAKAEQLSGAGRHEEALQFLAQAQALNPPQLNRVALLREEVTAANEQAQHQAQAAQLDQLFKRAMSVFEQGRYEEAVKLFEQVIAQEARLEPPAPASSSAGGGP